MRQVLVFRADDFVSIGRSARRLFTASPGFFACGEFNEDGLLQRPEMFAEGWIE